MNYDLHEKGEIATRKKNSDNKDEGFGSSRNELDGWFGEDHGGYRIVSKG